MVNKALQEEVVEIMNKRKCGSEFISTIGLIGLLIVDL